VKEITMTDDKEARKWARNLLRDPETDRINAALAKLDERLAQAQRQAEDEARQDKPGNHLDQLARDAEEAIGRRWDEVGPEWEPHPQFFIQP